MIRLNQALQREAMYLYFLCFIAFFSPLSQAEPVSQEVADLKLQLKNLKENLYQAENTPGVKGLEQVKYFQSQIDDIEEDLEKKGAFLAAPAQNNVPWADFEDEEKVHYQSYHLKESKKNPLHDNANEILNIDEKLNWLLQNKDNGYLDPDKVLGQMKALIKQREDLLKARKDLKEDPTTSILSYKSKQKNKDLQQDLMSKDPIYINILEEQLQQVYTQIFFLRDKTLKEEDGEKIKDYGQKISQLERQEKDLKKRLSALGHTPTPPRIIDPAYQKHVLQSPRSEDSYTHKILSFMAELQIKITDIKQKISQAGTGNEITNLGQQLTLLTHQLNMAKADLPQEASSALPKESQSLIAPLSLNPEPSAKDTASPPPERKEIDPLTQKIKDVQTQSLWSEIPPPPQSDTQIPTNSTPLYNAEALSNRVNATSQQEAEQAKVLQYVNEI